MAAREEARAARDFERADAIRERLAEMGWTVRDSAEGPSLVPRV
jgi:cysteinyl-tRNA synthetase